MQREQKTSTLIFYGDKYFLFLNFFYFLIIGSRSYKNSILIILVFYFSSFIFPFSSFVDSSFWEFFFLGGGRIYFTEPFKFHVEFNVESEVEKRGRGVKFLSTGVLSWSTSQSSGTPQQPSQPCCLQ